MLLIGEGCICGGKLGLIHVIVYWAVDGGGLHHDMLYIGYIDFES